MIVLDRLLIGGIKFVLGKVVDAVDAEMNDDSLLREELLAAQMRVELGEMSEEDFREFEADILERLRLIRERQGGGVTDLSKVASGEQKITGVEADIYGQDDTEPSS